MNEHLDDAVDGIFSVRIAAHALPEQELNSTF
jgi:hypothetical protein